MMVNGRSAQSCSIKKLLLMEGKYNRRIPKNKLIILSPQNHEVIALLVNNFEFK
jgi:hypothetical protein